MYLPISLMALSSNSGINLSKAWTVTPPIAKHIGNSKPIITPMSCLVNIGSKLINPVMLTDLHSSSPKTVFLYQKKVYEWKLQSMKFPNLMHASMYKNCQY